MFAKNTLAHIQVINTHMKDIFAHTRDMLHICKNGNCHRPNPLKVRRCRGISLRNLSFLFVILLVCLFGCVSQTEIARSYLFHENLNQFLLDIAELT